MARCIPVRTPLPSLSGGRFRKSGLSLRHETPGWRSLRAAAPRSRPALPTPASPLLSVASLPFSGTDVCRLAHNILIRRFYRGYSLTPHQMSSFSAYHRPVQAACTSRLRTVCPGKISSASLWGRRDPSKSGAPGEIGPQNNLLLFTLLGIHRLVTERCRGKTEVLDRVKLVSTFASLIVQCHHGRVRPGYESTLLIEDVAFEKTESAPMVYSPRLASGSPSGAGLVERHPTCEPRSRQRPQELPHVRLVPVRAPPGRHRRPLGEVGV
jgi:hypothetical protein